MCRDAKSILRYPFLIVGCLLTLSATVFARDILLIDDSASGFGPVAGILESEGHTVTEITGEHGNGHIHIADGAFLSNFDMVIFADRDGNDRPPSLLTGLETFVHNGGDLLITGRVRTGSGDDDRTYHDFLRALGPDIGGYFYPDFTVSNVDNFITKGIHGDYRGANVETPNRSDGLYANTGLGTIPLVGSTDGQPDKIIFTDLPGTGGSIGVWQGLESRFNFAQPDFFDGGVFQGMLLNWAEGGVTTPTVVTPQQFTTAAHPLTSTVTADLYLGDPSSGGVFITTLGSLELEGTLDVVSSLDSNGDGTVAITNASMVAGNVPNLFADFDVLGTALIDLETLDLYVANQTTAVTSNNFELSESPYYTAGLTEGAAIIHSPTGSLATLLDGLVPLEGTTDFYYGGPSELENAAFFGTLDDGLGLFTDRPELNLTIEDTAFKLFEIDGINVFAVLDGEFHVALVPEPSTWMLAGMAFMGFLALCCQRRSTQ